MMVGGRLTGGEKRGERFWDIENGEIIDAFHQDFNVKILKVPFNFVVALEFSESFFSVSTSSSSSTQATLPRWRIFEDNFSLQWN